MNHSRLPHWEKRGAAYFLTWRLKGSLPIQRVAETWTTEGAKFKTWDQLLDARATGPDWLRIPEVAEAVIEVLAAGQSAGYYELGSWVILPNHVHLLLRPSAEVSRLVRGLKSNNAKAANKILNRTGPFWSRDYFDRWVRDYDEEQRIIRYIEDNPIKAGLTNWPFSSASASRG